ncbi:hypothetical protein ACMBCM_08900, partial [Spiroplasma sp. K1]
FLQKFASFECPENLNFSLSSWGKNLKVTPLSLSLSLSLSWVPFYSANIILLVIFLVPTYHVFHECNILWILYLLL